MSNDSTNPNSTWKNRLETQARGSKTPERLVAESVDAVDTAVTDRQERIDGFHQAELSETSVLLVGSGGIGGEIGEGLVRKGVGQLTVCDEDEVNISNLNRQKFGSDDIGNNKARSLVRNLQSMGTTGTALLGVPYHFQDAVATGYEFDPDIVICAPDNDAARVAVADHFHGDVPVVFTGLDSEANGGYVFVQVTSDPCFRCFRLGADAGGACPAAPAVVDPTKVVAGIALYAAASVLMDRHRDWDIFEFFLSGVLPTSVDSVARDPDCPNCGTGSAAE